MKRIKGFVKRNIKLFIGIVVGGIIFGGGVYAATVAANTVSYSNASSGIAATNVQGAIDALYTKSNSLIANNATAYKEVCHKEGFSGTVTAPSGSVKYEYVASNVTGWCFIKASIDNCSDAGSGKNICLDNTVPQCISQMKDSMNEVVQKCCSEKCGSSSNSCYTTCTS